MEEKFDYEKMLAGEPVFTKAGDRVEIIKILESSPAPIVGVIQKDGTQRIFQWSKEGRFCLGPISPLADPLIVKMLDLVNSLHDKKHHEFWLNVECYHDDNGVQFVPGKMRSTREDTENIKMPNTVATVKVEFESFF